MTKRLRGRRGIRRLGQLRRQARASSAGPTLKWLLGRIPDLLVLAYVSWGLSIYAVFTQQAGVSPWSYSLISVAVAALGPVVTYGMARYGMRVTARFPSGGRAWRAYWWSLAGAILLVPLLHNSVLPPVSWTLR
jgi:hypothetical protein